MVKPDPLEKRHAPKDLRYILATLGGLFLIGAGAVVFFNVLQGATFTGNVGRAMGFGERVATTLAIFLTGVGLLTYAIRGNKRLAKEEEINQSARD